ncbi:hypothetical protein PAAL66ix_03701 [Paenibacillus alvei A6-6i-x]|nr:hypothetical protein PAAL66ix_03701 [Paenibacillus alvei A6-6i-x]
MRSQRGRAAVRSSVSREGSEKHWRETLTYKQFFAIANKRVHIQSFLVIVIYISEFIRNAVIFAHTIELNILNVDWLVNLNERKILVSDTISTEKCKRQST